MGGSAAVSDGFAGDVLLEEVGLMLRRTFLRGLATFYHKEFYKNVEYNIGRILFVELFHLVIINYKELTSLPLFPYAAISRKLQYLGTFDDL